MIYSTLVENWVFVATNVFMLLTAVTGQLIYRANKRREEREQEQRPGTATRNTETA